MNISHFEELWNESESLVSDSTSLSDLSNELSMKIAILKAVLDSSDSVDINSLEYKNGVGKLFGEVLFTLSHISAKTNTNVFKSMMDIFKMNQIDYFENKYK